jgi:hypothetical protein
MAQRAEAVSRRKHAIEAWQSAGETIGPIEHGLSIFAITRGQFSMIDIVNYLLSELGKSGVSIWTWVIADYEVEVMTALIDNGQLTQGNLIVDYSAGKRNPDIIESWRSKFGESSVKVCKNHAKLARIWNDDFKFLARGSMNLNFNPRFEQLDLTEGGPDYDLVEQIELELPVLPREHTSEEASAASKVNLAFEQKTLEIFGQDLEKSWKI